MDIGSTLTLILGTGFLTSVITLLGTYFFNKKQKEKDRDIELKDKIISEVYSPLLFYFFKVAGYLSDNTGNLTPLEEDDGSKQAQHIQTERLKKDCQFFCSSSIEQILLNKIGFLKPRDFRQELFLYLQLLESYERQMTNFADEGFTEDFQAEKEWLANMFLASNELVVLTVSFNLYVERLINQNKQVEPKYDKMFSGGELNNARFATVLQLIYSRNKLMVKNLESKLKNGDA